MATNVRVFNKTTDLITLAQGSIDKMGYATVFALCAPSTGGAQTIFSTGTSSAAGWQLQIAATGLWEIRNNSAPIDSTFAAFTNNNWYGVAVAKASGSATPRFHMYDCSAGTWQHGDGTGALADSSSPITRNAIGVNSAGTGAFFGGSIQLVAFWCNATNAASVLDDSEVAALVSLQAIITSQTAKIAAGVGAGLLILDQASAATPVLDYWRTLPCDQTAITGTTVSSVTIPNFDMTYPSGAPAGTGEISWLGAL